MARLFFIHWNKEEAHERSRPLRDAGHDVTVHSDSGEEAWRLLKALPPDALVVSLDRLPSHGRRVAAVTTEHKRLRDVPVMFAGGELDKARAARRQFPEAAFSDWFSLVAAVEALLARVAAERALNPVAAMPEPRAAAAPKSPRRARPAKRRKKMTRRTKTVRAAPRAAKSARRKKPARGKKKAARAKARVRKKVR
jgi:DNA-binding response OmpR family regulator